MILNANALNHLLKIVYCFMGFAEMIALILSFASNYGLNVKLKVNSI